MTEPQDRTRFGRTVKQLRLQKGLRQQDMVDRLDHYADVSAYRRVENGSRIPERDIAIAILVYGLEIRDKSRIDSFIAQAGYEALSSAEVADLKLQPTVPPEDQPVQPDPDPSAPTIRASSLWLLSAAVVSSLGLCALLFSNTEYGPWIGLLLSFLYAALFVISLLLETAYAPAARKPWMLVSVFCLMLLSSSVACVSDAALVHSGSGSGLALAMAIFASAAVLQAAVSFRALPNDAVVKAKVQMHTAQAAHLKNTCYFMTIVVLYWLPPLHAIAVLRHQLRLGHANDVHEILSHWLLLGHGIVSLNYAWLLALLPVIAILTIAMRSQLVDNLRPHPAQNSFLLLFYLRAGVYFTLAGICAFWYASAIASCSAEQALRASANLLT